MSRMKSFIPQPFSRFILLIGSRRTCRSSPPQTDRSCVPTRDSVGILSKMLSNAISQQSLQAAFIPEGRAFSRSLLTELPLTIPLILYKEINRNGLPALLSLVNRCRLVRDHAIRFDLISSTGELTTALFPRLYIGNKKLTSYKQTIVAPIEISSAGIN